MARTADPHAKEALVAAARAEFARRGLRGARIEDITSACGLSKGAFYLHFESKEGLFGLLVQELMTELLATSEERVRGTQAFFAEHGALSSADFQKGSAKLKEWDRLELSMDLRTLELLWSFRDVFDVLLSGAHGTAFEKTVWIMIDAEIARIAENHRKFQVTGCLRTDVEPELFGAMVVGTYLLVGKQMARAAEKPDLALLARSLQTLIHEGSVPRVPASPAAAARDLRPAAVSKRKKAVAKPKSKPGSARRNTGN